MPKRPVKSKNAGPAVRSRELWHAVSIAADGTGCDAVRALRATRFLSADAPPFPLGECSRAKLCKCKYRHHPDRRGSPRRKDEVIGLRRSAKPTQERRIKGGRRAID
jgi:hypothetical protein